MNKTDCCGDCSWCKPSVTENCEKLRKPWINVNKILCKCPYCGAVQHKSRRCKECGREVAE